MKIRLLLTALLLLGSSCSFAADTKISAMTDGGTVQTSDKIPAVRSGSNVKVSVGSMAAQSASSIAVTGGTIAGTSISGGSVSGSTISNGTIDNAVIGGSVPTTGTFSSLDVVGTGHVNFNMNGTVDYTNGGSVLFENSGDVSFGNVGGDMNISPSGNILMLPYWINIAPTTPGQLDNMSLGGSNPKTGKFTKLETTYRGTFTANGTTAVAVSDTHITANSTIIYGLKTVGGTPACKPYESAITVASGFSVKACVGDTSTYNYTIIN